MDMPKIIAMMRFHYHANMVDVNNVLNQLHIISDDKAEVANMHHVMTLFNDIFPRIYGEETFNKIMEKTTKDIANK